MEINNSIFYPPKGQENGNLSLCYFLSGATTHDIEEDFRHLIVNDIKAQILRIGHPGGTVKRCAHHTHYTHPFQIIRIQET